MSAKNRITGNEKKLSVMSRQPNETRRDVIQNFQESMHKMKVFLSPGVIPDIFGSVFKMQEQIGLEP